MSYNTISGEFLNEPKLQTYYVDIWEEFLKHL